jgi:uncharacterized protein
MRPIPARRAGPSAIIALLLIWCAGLPLTARAAELTFPQLSGRVVDAAGILKPEERAGLEAKLKAFEDKTSDQVVVATVPSLQGTTVEDFGNRLFRAWRLGQAKTNNGALLIVAPKERKVRIEVGYGLEGALTDALSKVIITTAITPRFKAGDFAGGIDAGVDAVLSILAGDADDWHRRAKVRGDDTDPVQALIFLVILIVIIVVFWRMSRGQRGRGGRGGFIIVPGPPSGGWSGGVSGGFGDGGGFSGGGGSSGGGGASGDW